jgi:uncharacterized protein YjdB
MKFCFFPIMLATVCASALLVLAACPIAQSPSPGGAVTGVSLSKTSLELEIGDKVSLSAAVQPDNAANKAVSWASSDADVAAVSGGGTVTAKAEGEATITVTTADGGFKADCTVTVSPAEPAGPVNVRVSGVSLNKISLHLYAGGSETLSAAIQPSNASNKAVSWASDNESVATVSGGTVKAVAPGRAAITCTTADGGFKADCTVTVDAVVPVSGVSLNKTDLLLSVDGGKETLIATVTPPDATNKDVTWTSSNAGVASVSGGGLVTAVSVGTATITVTTADGDFKAACAVSVERIISISVAQLSDSAPYIEGPTIYRSGGGNKATVSLENPGQYSSINWHITGAPVTGTGGSFTLDAKDAAYNNIGEHFLTVIVVKDGVEYNKTVTFTVSE